MTKCPVRDLHSSRTMQPRFCDVIVDEDKIYLEKKTPSGGYETILWDDVVYQVESAKQAAQKS